jgi:hypothetical protein
MIKPDAGSLWDQQLLLRGLDILGLRTDTTKPWAMQLRKALALGLSVISVSSSPTSSSTSAAASSSGTSGQGQFVQTGVYDSSITPSDLPWNTYNYCNAPHVNSAHYMMPSESGAEMVYMNVMIRHHKVRAVSSNRVVLAVLIIPCIAYPR